MPKYYKCVMPFTVIYGNTGRTIIIEEGEIYELYKFLRIWNYDYARLKNVENGRHLEITKETLEDYFEPLKESD